MQENTSELVISIFKMIVWIHIDTNNQQRVLGDNYFELYEPRCEKTGLRGFRPGLTQTRLYSYISWLEA